MRRSLLSGAAPSKRAKESWLDGWLEQQPVSATQTGKHDFDDRIEDLGTAGRQKFVDFSKQMLGELGLALGLESGRVAAIGAYAVPADARA